MHEKIVQEVLQGLLEGKEMHLDQLAGILNQPTVASAKGLLLKIESVRLNGAPTDHMVPLQSKIDLPVEPAEDEPGYEGLSNRDKVLIVLAENNKATIEHVRDKYGADGRWSGTFYELVRKGFAKSAGTDGRLKAYKITPKGQEGYNELMGMLE